MNIYFLFYLLVPKRFLYFKSTLQGMQKQENIVSDSHPYSMRVGCSLVMSYVYIGYF